MVQQAMLQSAAGYATCAAGYATCAAGYATCAAGYDLFSQIIMPLCGPSCKLRLVRFSARLRFQDRPSMAIVSSVSHTGILAMMW